MKVLNDYGNYMGQVEKQNSFPVGVRDKTNAESYFFFFLGVELRIVM